MEHVIDIAPSGQVRSMHLDKFSLGFLGAQKIERASDIRWDETTQSWGIWFNVDGVFVGPTEEYAGFPSYEEARAFEVHVMNEAMKLGQSPIHHTVRALVGGNS